MTKCSVTRVVILTFATLGIYHLIWLVKTKNEMNSTGANIPSAWWILVPFGHVWWMWKFCEGVALTTNTDRDTADWFWLCAMTARSVTPWPSVR